MYIQSQTFYLDPNAVNNSARAFITSIDLYFSGIPAQTSQVNGVYNLSGSTNPGVTISISDTDINGAPNYSSAYTYSIASLPYSSINVSSDASSITTFEFNQPVPLKTGKTYSINIQAADGGYTLWTASAGQALLGSSNAVFPGFSGGNHGQLFDYGTDGTLTPIKNTQLKYAIKVAQFTANNATYELVNNPYEFMIVQGQVGSFLGGETVFPLLANVSAQTVAITANSSTLTGNGTTFQSSTQQGSYIALYANTVSASGVVSANLSLYVTQIVNVSNNTSATINPVLPVSNSAAKFFFVPVGTVYNSIQSSNTMILTNSNANNTLYFTSNTNLNGTLKSGNITINAISSTTGLFVGQPVYCSNSSNSSAGITGFTNGSTITAIVNSTAVNVSTKFTGTNTSAGGANLFFQTPIVGSMSSGNVIITNTSFSAQTYAYVSSIYAVPVTNFEPEVGISASTGGNSSITYAFAQINSSGNPILNSSSTFLPALNGTINIVNGYSGYILSRSLEAVNGGSDLSYSNNKSGVIKIQLNQAGIAGALYDSPVITSEKLDIFSSSVLINNDTTNENTNYGNSLAKHITTQIQFDPTYAAEDLMVQATAFVPANTSIVAWAKLYNSQDSDPFVSKEWTRLYPSGNTQNLVSTIQANNYVTLTWGLPNSPPSLYTANGTATISGSTVTGANTKFGNSTPGSGEIYVNDLIKLWNPNVPNNFIVGLVTNVTNASSLNLNISTSNVSITGVTLFIDKISDKHQAFTDPQNNNYASYYNSTLAEFSTYDTMQIKLDLLSSNSSIYPKVATLTAVGLSA